MKKIILPAFIATLFVGGLAFTALSTQASSMQELRASGEDYCKPTAGYDCKSEATGNIYIGYEATAM